MPELPEVETVKRGLEKYCLNKTIHDVIVKHENIIANLSSQDFIEKIKNQTICSFSRKGKFLIIHLDKSNLLVHLRMEGKFKFEKELIDKHSHVIFNFNDGDILIYHDVRKFGKIYYFEKDTDIYANLPLSKLGLEPMEVNDEIYLFEKLKKVNLPIKAALLEQSILAGIGNIYADEICFMAKLHPKQDIFYLDDEDYINIANAAKIVIDKAILAGGTTIRSYTSSLGVTGLFQLQLNVHTKKGEPCPCCGNIVVKTRVAGRGTYLCEKCQKIKIKK